ncbi:Uncharacterised protein [Mycobacteroides abscessus subsp. abscessus]|nr:Uncharacterised protein [Mycobacteroides abscessus subsp. abscessus]
MGLPPTYRDVRWKARLHPIRPCDILGSQLSLGLALLSPLDLALALLVRNSDTTYRIRASATTRLSQILSAITALERGDVTLVWLCCPVRLPLGDLAEVGDALVGHEMSKAIRHLPIHACEACAGLARCLGVVCPIPDRKK